MMSADGSAAYVLGVNLAAGFVPATIYKITGNTANQAPTFDVAPSSPDPTTGAITYTVANPNDADGDGVTYTTSQPSHGTVALVNGKYLYTPSATAPADDTFMIYSNDGHGGVTARQVIVDVNTAAPVVDSVRKNTPATATGDVTGSVVAHDDDAGDTLHYGVVQGAKGVATINQNGTWELLAQC